MFNVLAKLKLVKLDILSYSANFHGIPIGDICQDEDYNFKLEL
jgi:hypothetical protein